MYNFEIFLRVISVGLIFVTKTSLILEYFLQVCIQQILPKFLINTNMQGKHTESWEYTPTCPTKIGLLTNQVSHFAVYGMEYSRKFTSIFFSCKTKGLRYFRNANDRPIHSILICNNWMSWQQETCSILNRRFEVAMVGQKSSIIDKDQAQQHKAPQ
ncbi:hypothetical protein F4703DRAFT_1794810 [Phycomyces blakesleeanus]|uniref:Uncharacterized protein n=1 Tax=Phycomyces blakesleeanus (strain ATCC 8743b / DSM 1359 / FGSC 10004 / NBRC 33097 / NRRL 1555) TaxID=763407 RepID=A0A162UAH1_PHYB8|nr:hypothetical protein PHYBLDRAFT_167127 [Phycomyces blakesleeanus NRRL 1555(-)]OAD74782.1 hypothetical protein PHYBLDRAFT_167127 [Phycomyces blakesleeanus NRRL 1555(-)]|eukprot:XP_018292822.1 hypothetical protein PHYBLDRAFT_167127 [Phycomyces blakesleeanus NRRL 1555(-)]